MKKTTLALAMGLMISGAANAALEANIGATSNYVWRGMTQTTDDAALSGGLDYSDESGVYVGAWASDVKWVDGYEFDVYGGYSSETADGIGYDLGFIHYAYPDATDSDFTELTASVTLGPVTAAIAHTISAETSSYEGDNYYSLSAGTDLEEGLSISGTLGYYDYNSDADSFTHAQIDLTKSLGDYGDITASVSKLNNDGALGADEGTLFFVSYSKTF